MKKINKAVITYLVTFIFSGLLHANDILDIKKELTKCADISDNLNRLTCFDTLAQPIELNKATLSNATTKVENVKKLIVQADKLAVVAVTEQSKIEEAFARPKLKTDETEIERISLTISKLSKALRGQWKITFTNGQVWQQKDSLKLSLKVGQSIEISKGALSAYHLKKVDSNKRIRVKRLK